MNTIEESFLHILLKSFNVPVDSWGTGQAKSISSFLAELQAGESYLRIDKNGMARIVEVISMHITDPEYPARGNLLEAFQILPDGRKRERRQMPSGKMKDGESPNAALTREIREELQLDPDDWTEKDTISTTRVSRPSRSYPGLTCIYVVHHFNVVLNTGSPALRDEFTVTEPNGTTLCFQWENIGHRR